MTWDELLRILFYCTLVSGGTFTGVKVWNASMMPHELRRPVAVFFWLQAAIYALLMISLLLTINGQSSPPLRWLNTILIGFQACTVLAVAVRAARFRKAMLPLITMVLTGGKL